MSVDSETQLTVAHDIFDSGEFYTIEYQYGTMTNILDLEWNEDPFSASGTLQAHNAGSTYDSYDARNMFMRIKRGYTYQGTDYIFDNYQYMKVIGQAWTSQPVEPEDAYILNFKGLWNILSNYKTPVDLFFNQTGLNDGVGSHSDDTTIESMTGRAMINYVLCLAGLSLGTDIEDTSAEYISTTSPQMTFYAGTNGAYMVISILALYRNNLVCRLDKMHLVIDDNTKSYQYNTPTNASYLSMMNSSYQEELPSILKCDVESADGTYSGSYTSTSPAWTPDMGKLTWVDTYNFVSSDALAAEIAQARVERAISNVSTGSAFLPIMDVCQEVWTETSLVDGRGNTTAVGLTGGLHFHYKPGRIYSLTIRLGGLSPVNDMEDYINNLGMGLGGIPADSIIGLPEDITVEALKWALILGGD